MAIIHHATISPTKQELLDRELGGPVEILGSYRFDDPAGEVGVEGFVVRRGAVTSHVLFSYRGAPIDARLVSTMEHSVLGQRWVYDGATDPVAVGCLRRALLGEQDQAVLEVWKDGVVVETREPTIRFARNDVSPDPDAITVQVRRDLDVAEVFAGRALVASWEGGSAQVAGLVDM